MNATDAALAVGLDYPGGIAALASRMGIPAGLLRKKLSPSHRDEHLTIEEAVHIQVLAGDHRILFAVAVELGYACNPINQERTKE